MIFNNITELIGKTPIVRLQSFSNKFSNNILGKCEFMNPTGSVKDRIALKMINMAIESGEIDKNRVVIEATSGNTGISLASICALKKLKLIITMPESMSIERVKILEYLGAEVILTPKSKGMQGSINKAEEIRKKYNGFIFQQFENINGVKAHEETTAMEIMKDIKNLDYLIVGVGTGGTITGVSNILKKHMPNLKIIAVEPKQSGVLSGENPNPHKIQGIGAGFIPKILNINVYDRIIQIDEDEAIKTSKKIAREEGILVGISSGANIAASMKLSSEISNQNRTILTILCDGAERYLSIF